MKTRVPMKPEPQANPADKGIGQWIINGAGLAKVVKSTTQSRLLHRKDLGTS
jgi:hypothetical protein